MMKELCAKDSKIQKYRKVSTIPGLIIIYERNIHRYVILSVIFFRLDVFLLTFRVKFVIIEGILSKISFIKAVVIELPLPRNRINHLKLFMSSLSCIIDILAKFIFFC